MNTSPQDIPLLNIYKFIPKTDRDIPGYFAVSTAPINVDDAPQPEDDTSKPPALPDRSPHPKSTIFELVDDQPKARAETVIKQIADYLLESKAPEIVIAIHGYNSNFSNVENWYKSIYEYINADKNLQRSKGSIFLGYRWPSEDLRGDESSSFLVKMQNAFNALPILPTGIFVFGLVVSIISTCALLIFHPYQFFSRLFFISLLIGFGIFSSLVLALIVLRLVVYFRDSYRATNFGVPDFVELIRQLDQSAFNSKLQKRGLQPDKWNKLNRKDQLQIEEEIEKGNGRIKLTFIGHSMGCFVVTNAIRILSDVFDPNSIGTLSSSESEKLPSKEIGRVFSLERLVLVAPDIPVETIIPRRANFLRSSLRRFEEAYIFSNEGDLALRLASTAANYFSFPAKTRISGYRLGNVTVKHFNNKKDTSGKSPSYGIVNLHLQEATVDEPYECLEIRSSNREHRKLDEIRAILPNEGRKLVANRFTYFDCTDYIDYKGGSGVVSDARRQPALNLWDYVRLTFTFFRGAKDTHGGYFRGEFSQQAIYQLAFLGFEGFLQSFLPKGQGDEQQFDELPQAMKEKLLYELSHTCQEKGIQVVLAPERYQANILRLQPDRSC